MKLTIRYFSLLVIIVFANLAHAQKAVENRNLPNFSKVNANLYRGGQPTEAGVKELKRLKVRTIISLRGLDENSIPEEKWAQDAGIKFIGFNLSNWFEPKTEDIEIINKVINKPENQPVFVHCKRGADRTGTVVAVYRIRHDGLTAQEAIAEAKKFDFGWWQFWMKDFIKDYYRDFKRGK
jgi:protein tyrosine/serine phosphatase